jgi:hypothetical protein
MIEAISTYRGWFVGGDQSGDWGNSTFVAAHVARHGALGDYFAALLKGTIKMGDSPAVGYLLNGTPTDPAAGGWGGKFVRIWDGRKTVFTRLTTEADSAEAFGVVEFAIPLPPGMTRSNTAKVTFDGRINVPVVNDGRTLRFRFSPRDAKLWPYTISSDFPAMAGLSGKFTAAPPPAQRTARASATHPNWWIDDPDPAAAEGVHAGARHVSRWRHDFLTDFKSRMLRCTAPNPSKAR